MESVLDQFVGLVKSKDSSNHQLAQQLIKTGLIQLDFMKIVKQLDTFSEAIPLKLTLKNPEDHRKGQKTFSAYFFSNEFTIKMKSGKTELHKCVAVVKSRKQKNCYTWQRYFYTKPEETEFTKIEVQWEKYDACVDKRKLAKSLLKKMHCMAWMSLQDDLKAYIEGEGKIPEILGENKTLMYKKLTWKEGWGSWMGTSNNYIGRLAVDDMVKYCFEPNACETTAKAYHKITKRVLCRVGSKSMQKWEDLNELDKTFEYRNITSKKRKNALYLKGTDTPDGYDLRMYHYKMSRELSKDGESGYTDWDVELQSEWLVISPELMVRVRTN